MIVVESAMRAMARPPAKNAKAQRASDTRHLLW
jgi:hypothetical protein